MFERPFTPSLLPLDFSLGILCLLARHSMPQDSGTHTTRPFAMSTWSFIGMQTWQTVEIL